MTWIYFYLIPLAAAWKKRTGDPAVEFLALCGTMLSVFLAVWCEGAVSAAIGRVLPGVAGFCRPWISCGALLLIWGIAYFLFNKLLEQVVPQGVENFIFPAKLTKPLTFALVFFNTGLVCALLFTAFAVSPAAHYVPFIAKDDALCASARLRILSNSFFIDRLSWQSASINQRRRAFDRFIPETPGKIENPNNTPTQSRKVN